MNNKYLALQDAMTESERAAFLQTIAEVYSSLRGAHVADILEIFDNQDMHIGLVEDLYERHCHEVPPGRRHLIGPATLAILYASGGYESSCDWLRIKSLVQNVNVPDGQV